MNSKNTKSLKGKEQGTSGTSISGGVILFADYNRKLNGLKAITAYEEMRNDASVNASLEAIKLPIENADFVVDPASDDEVDKQIAKDIDDNIHEILDQYLTEAGTFLEFGFCLHEMVFDLKMVDGRPLIWLTKLGYRKQTTIQAWETEDHQPGVTQLDPLGNRHSIPAVKLVRLTRKQEGENYFGRSILRTSYRNYFIKDKLYKIDAVGHERHALGVLDVTTPKGALDKDKKKMRQLARSLRANEESYLEHPEGWIVQFLDNKASSMRDVEPSINHHDRQIMKNVLAQFLEIGSSGSSGTRNVSEDQSRLFELAVQSVAKQIVSTLQNTVVKALVDLNYTGRDYPTLRVSNISDDNIPVISDAVSKFTAAGALTPRPEDENTTRRMIGWGELTEEEIKEIKDAKEKAAAAPPPLVVAPADKKPVAEKVKAAAQVTKARALFESITRRLYDRPSKSA